MRGPLRAGRQTLVNAVNRNRRYATRSDAMATSEPIHIANSEPIHIVTWGHQGECRYAQLDSKKSRVPRLYSGLRPFPRRSGGVESHPVGINAANAAGKRSCAGQLPCVQPE